MERTALVFDIGGTTVRAGCYAAPSGELSRVVTCPTPNFLQFPPDSPEQIRDRLLDAMLDLSKQVFPIETPEAVALSFAGPIDEQRRALSAPTIWGRRPDEPIELLPALAERWPNSRLVMENDVTAAGYRYLTSADEDLCIVTVSSGIGNKVFLQGRPALGPHGRGGEIGHCRVSRDADAPRCDCGGQGHLGAVSSGRGTLRSVHQAAQVDATGFRTSHLGGLTGGRADAITNEQIVAAFHAGDGWTARHIQTCARPLGQVLATIHVAVGVERFVLIGGFALAMGETYRNLLAGIAADHCWAMGQDWNRMLELGIHDDYAGLIGIGRRALEFTEELSHDDISISNGNAGENGNGGSKKPGNGNAPADGRTLQLPRPTRRHAA